MQGVTTDQRLRTWLIYAADQPGYIDIKATGQDGNEYFFRIRRSTRLEEVMSAYCDRLSVDLNSIAFLFDGSRLRAEQTPDELGMENGAEIRVMPHQTGQKTYLIFAADQPGYVDLKATGQDGNEYFFRIKRSTRLEEVMSAYCDRLSVDLNSIAFLFDGRRLRAEQTPHELGMENGAEIRVMPHQTGSSVA